MAWTAVITVAVGDPMTAALWNTYLRDNGNYLANSSGDVLIARHLLSTTTAPTVTVGAGAGTGATASISGTDVRGKITIVTGTGTAANTAMATVTFGTAYGTAPHAVLDGSAAAAAACIPYINGQPTTTAFTMQGQVAPAASTTMTFEYVVIG